MTIEFYDVAIEAMREATQDDWNLLFDRAASNAAAMSTWRQCAEARAAQLVAAQQRIADQQLLIAAQQAVIDAANAQDEARDWMFEHECDLERQASEADAAFPVRALRGGDGIIR